MRGLTVPITLITLTGALVALDGARSPIVAQAPTKLEQLAFKTGWILLGYHNQTTRVWRTAETFAVDARSSDWPSTPVPKVGDTIRIVSDLQVVILNFQTSGEGGRGRSPASRILNKSDLTGIVLKAGVEVRVRELRYEKQTGPIGGGVWARVKAIPGR